MKFKKKSISLAQVQCLYRDPTKPGSLGGLSRFAKTNKIPVSLAQKALEADLGYTLHKPGCRHFETSPVMVFGIDQQWAADLVEVANISRYNKGTKYLLMVIDVFSKFGWVEPLKSKMGQVVTEGFKKILKRSKGRKPVNLQTDDGKEFYNKTFQTFLKQKNIHHFSTSGDAKGAVVERFNRTLKERLYHYFTVKNSLSFLDVLQKLVSGYNASNHRSIKMAPKKVSNKNELEVWNNLYLN